MSKHLTPLGKWLRIYRVNEGMKLHEMAAKLYLSSAHLSGIENGRKKVPADFKNRIISTFKFSNQAIHELSEAVVKSIENFKMESVPLDRRDVAAAPARRFNELPDKDLEAIRKIISKGGVR